MITNPSSSRVCYRAPLALCFTALCGLSVTTLAQAQTRTAEQEVVVTGEELPSAYGAPTSFSQSRFSPTTNAYVLPPGAIYSSLIYEDSVVHFRTPDHDFTIETEFGLPYRFNVAMETDIEHYQGETQVRSFSLEARYAFADWNKIPLNPTIFAEYKFGAGNILHDEGPPTPGRRFGPTGFDKTNETPDAYELRLLLAEDFFERIEWALNGFFEQELEGDRGREWGIAQSVVTPIRFGHSERQATDSNSMADHKAVADNRAVAGTVVREELKVGIECLFRSFTDKGIRGTPYNSFVIGPTAAWRPSRNTRLDISPLFGVNHKSPIMQLFVVASYYFGGGSSGAAEGGEAPASTRNR
jgi:hypothetical protein